MFFKIGVDDDMRVHCLLLAANSAEWAKDAIASFESRQWDVVSVGLSEGSGEIPIDFAGDILIVDECSLGKLPKVCLERLRALSSDVPTIVVCEGGACADTDPDDSAVRELRANAAAYLVAPRSGADVVRAAISALEQASERRDRRAGGRTWVLDDVLGLSEESRRVREEIAAVVRRRPRIALIRGEVGVGKQTIARVIHNDSGRGDLPFVRVRCAGLGARELAFELERVPGDTGTVFLTEVDALDTAGESKLLEWILASARAELNGGDQEGARPDSAISIILSERSEPGAISSGLDRTILDLVAGSMIDVPPLRRRAADFDLLTPRFLRSASEELGARVIGIDAAVQHDFLGYAWPGNVAELRGVIDRAVLVASGDTLDRDSVPSSWLVGPKATCVSLDGDATLGDSQHHESPCGIRLTQEGIHLEHLERDLVLQALNLTHGNKTRAGRLLGLNRDQIRYRVEKFGLGPNAGKT